MSRTTNGWHNRLFEIKFGYITNLEYPECAALFDPLYRKR